MQVYYTNPKTQGFKLGGPSFLWLGLSNPQWVLETQFKSLSVMALPFPPIFLTKEKLSSAAMMVDGQGKIKAVTASKSFLCLIWNRMLFQTKNQNKKAPTNNPRNQLMLMQAHYFKKEKENKSLNICLHYTDSNHLENEFASTNLPFAGYRVLLLNDR